jgi:hypothetical protein
VEFESPTSTNGSRSLTCSFAFSKHGLSGLGSCWVRDGVGVGVLEAVGQKVPDWANRLPCEV